MFRRILLGAAIAAFSAGIATSAVRAKLASPPVAIAASSWGLDVSKIEREASYEGILSFDEMYQPAHRRARHSHYAVDVAVSGLAYGARPSACPGSSDSSSVLSAE